MPNPNFEGQGVLPIANGSIYLKVLEARLLPLSLSYIVSLRSKRFGKAFRTFAPIFARLKNKKCLERAENLTETLATQATTLYERHQTWRCDI